MINWIERYFYNPSYFQLIIAILLSPFSFIYTIIIIFKKIFTSKVNLYIPIISIGNIVLGGTGKTPLTKAIFKEFSNTHKVFIILRGYKRKSEGLVLVCLDGKILVSVSESGDEAMEYATTLKNVNVIVCKNRFLAIKEAKERGANLILLDDGFSKFKISKFDILLKPYKKPKLSLTIPSGAYRYPTYFYKYANFIPSVNDIYKKTEILNKTAKMVLVTAIANPERLKDFYKYCIATEFFKDHYDFKKEELENIIKKYNATSLLVTNKDFVKIKDFDLNISLITLEITLSENFIKKLKNYTNSKIANK